MTTDADRRIDEARDATKAAIVALSDVLINECHGHDEYRDEFTERLEQAFASLQQARKFLK